MHLVTAVGLIILSTVTCGKRVLQKGKGFGTYYYDVERPYSCETNLTLQNGGFVHCESNPLPLTAINSNYLVAMNNTQLNGEMSLYCGKKVVVTVDGLESRLPLFIGDGCQRCSKNYSSGPMWNANGAPGLDFSYSVLNELSQGAACHNGHVEISWEILDEDVYDFGIKSKIPTVSIATGFPSFSTPKCDKRYTGIYVSKSHNSSKSFF